MKKKTIILLLFIIILLCGCTPLQKMNVDDIITTTLDKNLRVYNTFRKGYKYNLPKGFSVANNTDFNEIITSRDYMYYLYIDGVSYYNKIIENYEENKTSFKSKQIVHQDKYGYLEINKLKSGKYLVEIMYNYAKIEVVVKEEDINVTISNSINILKSIIFNNNVLKNILGDETTQAKEFDFNIFETASSKKSEYLEAIDGDIYQDEGNIHDSDLID